MAGYQAATHLRFARGRYGAERAAQLSGVPKSTLYDWRREGVYVPDYDKGNPAGWSYRDLVFLRLLAWLRQMGVQRPDAANAVQRARDLAQTGRPPEKVYAARSDVEFDTGHQVVGDPRGPWVKVEDLLGVFRLDEPIAELTSSRTGLWGPNLVHPSELSLIVPGVMAGEPCVAGTRISTVSLHALATERGLPAKKIAGLYPGLTVDQVNDATALERRLRGGLTEAA